VLITNVLMHFDVLKDMRNETFPLLIIMKVTVMTKFIEPVLCAGRHHTRGLICTTPHEKETLKKQPYRNIAHGMTKDKNKACWMLSDCSV